MKTLYSATINGTNKINIFNVTKGVRSLTISLGNVTIVNGPVITEDKLTIVVKDMSGKLSGKVYTLPKGILSYSFCIK